MIRGSGTHGQLDSAIGIGVVWMGTSPGLGRSENTNNSVTGVGWVLEVLSFTCFEVEVGGQSQGCGDVDR